MKLLHIIFVLLGCLIHSILFGTTQKGTTSNGDTIRLVDYEPFDFLEHLKQRSSKTVFLEEQVEGWIEKDDLKEFIPLIYSEETCSRVSLQTSSFLPKEFSTVSNEACFLIEGFMEGGCFPPSPSSQKGILERKERVLKWINAQNMESEDSPL